MLGNLASLGSALNFVTHSEADLVLEAQASMGSKVMSFRFDLKGTYRTQNSAPNQDIPV